MRLSLRVTFACAIVASLATATQASPTATPAPPVTPRVAPATRTPATASTSTAPAQDPTGTALLHARADDARRGAGLEPLYGRTSYFTAARNIATALIESDLVVGPSDSAPIAYVGGVSPSYMVDAVIAAAVDSVVDSATAVLSYPLHTDGGWSVVTAPLPGGSIRYGIALVVGWPAPPTPTTSGCAAASGYCWTTGGLNPHLPWTRNAVRWYLSTSHLPANGQSLVKSAIAGLNAVPGFGADLVYGGLTTDTAPTPSHRFVVVWGGGCPTANALACTVDGTQGSDKYVYQARTLVTASRYAANPSTTWWVGTLMHEMAHAIGLGHFDGTYAGGYQLMRWAGGPNTVRPGDANGLRRLAPAGPVSATIRAVPGGAKYTLFVRAANPGLGGIRAIRAECRDANGYWHTMGSLTGLFDGRAVDRAVAVVQAGTTCRAVVRSNDRVATTAPVTLG
jgi:hypothetical protein